MKLLLFGARGQVGWELQRALAPLGDVTALTRQGQNGLSGDLADPVGIEQSVDRLNPDVIVNAAAYTAVDQAESEPELAQRINAGALEALGRAAHRYDALLVHYSTDYVFDGGGDQPWRETDQPAPLNAYGRTKLAGERALRESGCAHLVFRTSWVYAARGRNFLRTMLRLACEREALKVVDDQFGAPTGAELIADVTAAAIPMVRSRPELAGTYHLAAAGETTWAGYARFLIARAREQGWPITVADQNIESVGTDAFPTAALRPKNSRLSAEKLEAAFGLRMPDWQFGVGRVVSELGSG